MNMQYGKQIATALTAIHQLYADTSKLLRDCDRAIGQGRSSLYGNEVTRDLSRALGSYSAWMPSALYRYYDAEPQTPNLVLGSTISFFDEVDIEAQRQEEPLFILGEIQFDNPKGESLRTLCEPWTLWNAYYSWGEELLLNQVILPEAETILDDVGSDDESSDGLPVSKAAETGIVSPAIKLIAVPLYSIQSIEDVERLLRQLRAEE